MSMRSYFTSGYGFETYDVNPSVFIDFLLNHMDTLKKIVIENGGEEPDSIMDNIRSSLGNAKKCFVDDCDYDVDDLDDDVEMDWIWEYFDCADDTYHGFIHITANVIEKETNIPVEFYEGQEDCVGCDSILVVDGQPWQMSDTYRQMTKEMVDTLLKSYMEELGIEGSPTYIEVEAYG